MDATSTPQKIFVESISKKVFEVSIIALSVIETLARMREVEAKVIKMMAAMTIDFILISLFSSSRATLLLCPLKAK